MKSNSTTYCELELISPDEGAIAQAKSTPKNWLNAVWKYMSSFLVNNSEPKIWTTRDRFGVTHWHLYDLSIGQTMTFESEYEILVWLDDRYYR